MALKVGSKTISTANFIDFNGSTISKVIVQADTRTLTNSGTIGSGNFSIIFSCEGDTRAYQKEIRIDGLKGSASVSSITSTYSSSTNKTTYTASGRNNGSSFSYQATLYVWLDPIIVWQSTAKDLVVVVTGYRSPDGNNTDVGCEIHNISGVRIVGFKLTVAWDDGVSELYRYQVDHSSTSIAAGGSFIDESIQKYYDPSIVGILVSVRAFYSDGSQEIASDNISVSDLVESSQL